MTERTGGRKTDKLGGYAIFLSAFLGGAALVSASEVAKTAIIDGMEVQIGVQFPSPISPDQLSLYYKSLSDWKSAVGEVVTASGTPMPTQVKNVAELTSSPNVTEAQKNIELYNQVLEMRRPLLEDLKEKAGFGWNLNFGIGKVVDLVNILGYATTFSSLLFPYLGVRFPQRR